MEPKVIVHCTTYKHEKFLAQALDGFIVQKTNFAFEVYVAEDCSPDGTAAILREYADKYPEIIKPVYRERNLINENYFEMACRTKAEYVAWCEGDDYWTDPLKLQKQVDFLDAHLECSLCFHPVVVKWEDGSKADYIYPEPKVRFNKTKLELKDLLDHNFIQTNSVMYRWRFGGEQNIRDYLPADVLCGDWYLHLLHAEIGKIGFIDEPMGVYRKHSGGMWYGAGETDDFYIRNGLAYLNCLCKIDDYFKSSHHKEIMDVAYHSVLAFMKNSDFEQLNELQKRFSDLYLQLMDDIKEALFPTSRGMMWHYKLLSKFSDGTKRKLYSEMYKQIRKRRRMLMLKK